MEENPNQPYKVVIYNQTYSLRSEHDPDYIHQLAAHVDQCMNEIARAGMTVDSLRVAILAALQITDELYQARKEIQTTEEAIAERSAKYADLLDQALRPDPIESNK